MCERQASAPVAERRQHGARARQGTNDLFFDDPSVMFVSVHQAGSWPFTGAVREAGAADGEGFTINLPVPGARGRAPTAACSAACGPSARRAATRVAGSGLSEPARRAARIARACGRRSAAHRVSGSRARAGDSGDAAMAAAFDEVVGPAAERFQPDIILARSPPARAPARAAPVACTEPAATADGRYRPELRRSRATCRRHAACAARGRRSTRARPGLAVACHA